MEVTRVAWALQHLAAITSLRPQVGARPAGGLERAARLLGFVDACFVATGATRDELEEEERDRAFAALRDALSVGGVAKLAAEGAALTEEQAVEETLT